MTSIVNNEKPRFVYWKINARAQMSMLMLRCSNMEYEWDSETANKWPEPKEQMPFGQLPVLYHNNLTIAQSGAIVRYCAKLANLWPQKVEDEVMADMLIEQSEDIFKLFGKAKYAGDEDAQREAWIELRDTKLPQKLDPLVGLLGNKTYFSGESHHAGDVAIFSTLFLVKQAGLEEVLSSYPTLLSHYENVSKLGCINEFMQEGQDAYFKATGLEDLLVSE